MPNLDAPARLAFWPERPWDQGSDYDTLRQALAEAAQHPAETAWIVTLSGKILKPREVAELISTLRDEGKARIRCFPWLKTRSQTGIKELRNGTGCAGLSADPSSDGADMAASRSAMGQDRPSMSGTPAGMGHGRHWAEMTMPA